LTSSNVRAYAPIDPLAKPASSANPSSLSEPLRLVTGVGHTLFQRRGAVLVYRSELSKSDGTVVSAIPVRVAKDLYGRPETSVPEIIAVRIGPKEVYEQHTFKYDGRGDDAQLSPLVNGAPVQLENKLIIVGSLEEDSDRFQGRSGPELLAWALLARMARADEAVGPRPLESPLLFAALLIVFPVTSVAVYQVTLRRRKTRERVMWLAAGFAVLLAVCGLGGVVAALYALGHLYAQVTLVVVAIVVAVAVACFATFHGQLLASLEADLESGKLQAAEIYDVFISYSREPSNAKWVEEHVCKPLASARHQDGTPFKIFFDTRSIRLGDFWYRRLALAIAASRHFVPIYSDDYFDKAFCQHEMTLALARSVKKPDFILPLRRTSKPVPPGYDHIQHVDVAAQPDFIKNVLSVCAR
jgi:hypothetical protein